MIYKFDVLDSTNKYLKQNYNKYQHLDVITALHQTAGRGRLGRDWNDDQSALFSILIKEKQDIKTISSFSLVAAAATYNTLYKYYDNIKIKWPNDILINNKKVAGILLESIIDNNQISCLVVGIGININTKSFPKQLMNKATSLFLETNNNFNIDDIIIRVLDDFKYYYDQYKLGNKDYLNICINNSSIINKNINIRVNGDLITALATGITEDGNLILNYQNKIIEVNSGEVTLQDNYK